MVISVEYTILLKGASSSSTSPQKRQKSRNSAKGSQGMSPMQRVIFPNMSERCEDTHKYSSEKVIVW